MAQQGHGPSPMKDAQATRLAFYDKFLKGRDSGMESLPAVASQANIGPPVASTSFPPAGTRTVTRSLKSFEGTGDTWQDADKTLDESDVLSGDARDGVSLLFRGKPVARTVRISGPAELDATLTSDADSTYLTPVLFDEAPD